MPPAAAIAGSALLGGISGAFANDENRGKMTTAGNAFNLTPAQIAANQGIMQDAAGNIRTDSGASTAELQNNPLLSSIFGQGGTMDRTASEENRLSNQGFELTPEDKTAYGQISGDIARQFGQSDQSLSQALSDRGMSNSGVAGAAFTGSQGSKMEQLAQTQQKIAQQRFQSNLQRLGQTRQFLSSLSAQGMNDINQMQNNANSGQQEKYNIASSNLGQHQGQMNNELNQEQLTKHGSDIGNIFNGLVGGGMGGAKMFGGGGGMGGGGMGGAGGAGSMGSMAGGGDSLMSMGAMLA